MWTMPWLVICHESNIQRLNPQFNSIKNSNTMTATLHLNEEQSKKLHELEAQGYTFDEHMSIAACGVVMAKGNDVYFLGLEGEIMHNPDGLKPIVLP